MRLVGALDQLVPALGQHLDRDVVGDQVLLDQLADEVEVGLAGRREADLDLLEAHLHQRLEHAPLALGSIGSMRAWLPSRRSTEHHSGAASMRRFGPRAVGDGERQRQERLVLLERHRLRGGGRRGHRGSPVWVRAGKRKNLLAGRRRRFGECLWGTRLHEKEEAEVSGSSPTRVPGSARPCQCDWRVTGTHEQVEADVGLVVGAVVGRTRRPGR